MDFETLSISGRAIGPGEPCYVIAEIGVNHNGDLDIARRLIDAAAEAGADAVKFQKRTLSDVYDSRILRDARQSEQALQYIVPLLQEFELGDDDFRALKQHADARGVTFLCTAWDPRSLDFLETLGVPAYKVGSPDLTNHPLIHCVLATGKPLLISTGMATEDEIRETLRLLDEARAKYGVFHCVSTYPAMPDEINLRFMRRLRDWTAWPVGYSGHERGIAVSLGAVAMGASMLERHLTLDQNMRGPDHSASLEPAQFASQVAAIREIESAYGVPRRWITRGEFLNRRVLAKSLVAACEVPEGTVIGPEMVTARSPGLGLSPSRLPSLVGRRMKRTISREQPFTEADLCDDAHQTPAHAIDIGVPWGIIARFNDVDDLIERFESRGMSLVEFHLSDRDLDSGVDAIPAGRFEHELIVHGPEYCHDELIDLCSSDADQRTMSVRRLQMAIDAARRMAPAFSGTGARGPKVVIHVGGMSEASGHYDQERAFANMIASLRRLEHDGADVLIENLPPCPWFFGGRWIGHVLTHAAETVAACQASGLGLCFDTSHAALACYGTHHTLTEFAAAVRPFVRHLHISDAAGRSGEGLQIGDGEINFIELLPLLFAMKDASAVPEVWLGHRNNGAGFDTALQRLTEITWTIRALERSPTPQRVEAVQAMVVPSTANVVEALRAIDANSLGTAFVTDARGVVLGVVTDGDIRRGLMNGSNLRNPVTELMNRDYTRGLDSMSPEELRRLVTTRHRVVPVVDAANRLVGCVSINDVA